MNKKLKIKQTRKKTLVFITGLKSWYMCNTHRQQTQELLLGLL